MDDDYEQSKPQGKSEYPARLRYVIKKMSLFLAQGSTSNIWNRVASAAGSLTVNVGKAWAANLSLDSGEGNFTLSAPAVELC